MIQIFQAAYREVRQRLLPVSFSILVTIGVFYYLFKIIRPADIINLVRDLSLPILLTFLCLSLSMSLFRSWRYLLLLKAAGYNAPPVRLFLIIIIRNFFSDLLPARVGSLVYIYLTVTRVGIPLHTATSSFGVSLLLDAISIAPFIIVAVLATSSGATDTIVMIAIGAGILFLGALLLFAIRPLAVISSSFLRKKTYGNGTISRLLLQIAGFCDYLSNDLKHYTGTGILTRLLVLSALIRITKYGSMITLLLGMLAVLGYDPAEVSIPSAFLGILGAETSASLPISGIGGFGAYEGTWTFLFVNLGYPKEVAAVTAVSHHLFTQVYGYSLGALAILVLFTMKKCSSEFHQSQQDSSMNFYGKLLLTSSSIYLLSLFLWSFAASADKPSGFRTIEIAPEVVAARKEMFSALKNGVLFDSNRSGSFGIYELSVTDGRVVTVIDSPREEMYPDVSPDGKLIVYAKSRSTSRLSPSEIWLYNRKEDSHSLIARNGTFPTFSGDGSKIFFERNRRKVMEYALQEKEIREIFPADLREFSRLQIVKPRVSPDGKYLAFTSDKPHAWHAWIVALDTLESTLIGKMCEPAWFPDSKKLAVIDKTKARAGSGIFLYDLKTREREPLLDGDDPYGHEYFPTVSADGRFLLFSASHANEHSHITAPYEIFVLDLKTNQKVQFTSDTATDRWPKLLPEQ